MIQPSKLFEVVKKTDIKERANSEVVTLLSPRGDAQ